jgi:hypothetical protein
MHSGECVYAIVDIVNCRRPFRLFLTAGPAFLPYFVKTLAIFTWNWNQPEKRGEGSPGSEQHDLDGARAVFQPVSITAAKLSHTHP